MKAFRDGDRGPDKGNSIYSLPGTMPPEKEVFFNKNVQSWLLSEHGVDFPNWLVVNSEIDFHDWPEVIAAEISKSEEGLWEQACTIYAKGLGEKIFSEVIGGIELNT